MSVPHSVPKAGVRTIEGVRYIAPFLESHEEVFAWAVAHVDWDERIRARKTASYGVPYDYAGLTYARRGFASELETVREQVNGQLGEAFNNCLLNYYPDGRSRMGFHSDSAEGIVPGTGVAIVSLGCQRNLRFRRTAQLDDRLDYVLAPGSLLYMEALVQDTWQHSIPRNSRPLPRISLTFRTVARVH